MSRYWSDFSSYSQPSVEELKRKAQASVSSAKKKGRILEPVLPHSSKGPICQSWWGQAWCENLERYADYGSRLERGRRYVRSGTVVDLKIQKGKIEARVQGTRRTPYKVEIRISPLSEEKCQVILEKCGRRIQNMEDLVYGKFPEDLKTLFTQKDGIFPSPAEISFMCSCPDWALMCKHVAAVMYGIGLRLDENPFYFFELRGIDVDRFINVALETKVESMLSHASAVTSRMMNAEKIPALFGVLDSQDILPHQESLKPLEPLETPITQKLPDTLDPQIIQKNPDGQDSQEAREHQLTRMTTDTQSFPSAPGNPQNQESQKNNMEMQKDHTSPISQDTKELPSLPRFKIQSNAGQEADLEDLTNRLTAAVPGIDHIYVKPGENRVYWTAGEKRGSVEMW